MSTIVMSESLAVPALNSQFGFLQAFDLGFDRAGDVGKRGSAVGSGEFDAAVFAGIVAGRDVDGAIELLLHDGERDGRRRHRPRAQLTRMPCDVRTRATSRPKSSEANRVS